MLIVQSLVFGFSTWLGLYLIARNGRNPQMLYDGLGIFSYALSVAAGALSDVASTATPGISADIAAGIVAGLEQVRWPLTFLPALFWTGAIINILPDGSQRHTP